MPRNPRRAKAGGGGLGAYLQGGTRHFEDGQGTHDPGTTSHALLVLTAIELVALLFLRSRFKSAHGG